MSEDLLSKTVTVVESVSGLGRVLRPGERVKVVAVIHYKSGDHAFTLETETGEKFYEVHPRKVRR